MAPYTESTTSDMRDIFKEPPLVTFRQGKSLKDILAKAKSHEGFQICLFASCRSRVNVGPSTLLNSYLATKTDPKEPLPISPLSLRSDHLKVGRSCKAGDDCTHFLSFKEGNLKAMWKRRLDLRNSNFPASELLPLYVNM